MLTRVHQMILTSIAKSCRYPLYGIVIVALSVLSSAAIAQPVDPEREPGALFILGDAKEEIRALREEMSDLEIRLSKQITLLQRQINQLSRQLEAEKAAAAE